MPTDQDDNGPAGSAHRDARAAMKEEAEALGVQKRSHGDVQHWLQHNVEDEEHGPVVHAEHDDRADQVATAQEAHVPSEDNLVQLPIGATFGMDHKPSAHEREDLIRFAAAADAELGGRGGDDERRSGEERSQVEPEEDDE